MSGTNGGTLVETEKCRLSGLIRPLSAVLLAAAVLGITPLPLTAEVFQGSSDFGEAGSAFVQFTVNQDGSVTGSTESDFGGWYLPGELQCGLHICITGVDVPAFPPGSGTAAAFSFEVSLARLK